MKQRRLFTSEEIDYIRENWQKRDKELSAALGRSIGAIRTKRRELGLIGKENERKSSWSSEEVEKIKELWGEKTIPQIAKLLNRSVTAVNVKSKRLHLGGQTKSGELMTSRAVSDLLKVDIHTVTDYWIPKCGLNGKKKNLLYTGKATLIKFNDLIDWLEHNQDKWDSRRLELYALGCEYDWLKKKRITDKIIPQRRFQKWTEQEDMTAIHLFKKGLTHKEISEQLNRSIDSVERRISRLDVWGTGKYIRMKNKSNSEFYNKKVVELKLLNALKFRFNKLNYDGYWQKEMCMNWDDIKGCTAGETNCDTCTSFLRIIPQNCKRCGATFLKRKISLFCDRCAEQRKKQAQRKWVILHKNKELEA